MDIPKITFVVSTDNALAREHAQELSALHASFVIWPEQALHPSKHFKQIAHKLKEALAGDRPLVILTHSNAILSAVGELVEAKEIPREDVEVRLVEEDGRMRRCRYTIDGCLGDACGDPWPIGFFYSGVNAVAAWRESA